VALLASLVASPLVFGLRLVLGVSMAWKAAIVLLASAYIVYLLARSSRTASRTTFAVLSVLVLLASLGFEIRWSVVALIAVALIWGIRAYAYSQSLVVTLLHGGICLLGLSAALWAYAHSGSIALASWSFFLMQAAFGLVPPRLAGRILAEGSVTGEQEVDSFVLAYQAAQKALGRLRSRAVPGGE
jgi:hypothetical protein